MAAVEARARKVILDSRAGNEDWLADMANVELPRGHTRFAGAREAIERAVDYDPIAASSLTSGPAEGAVRRS